MAAIGSELVIPFTIGEPEGGGSTPAPVGTTRPPLGLQAEIVYADGTTSRWDSDQKETKDQPTGITFKTQRYTGFADCQLTLNRRIDRDYPDLGLYDGLNLIGYDGTVAYEGRIGSLPRSLEASPKITVQTQGWMSHARDQTFTEIYVDRDLSHWSGPTLRRQIAQVTANSSPQGPSVGASPEGTSPALITGGTGPWAAEGLLDCEGWYNAHGIQIGVLYTAWTFGQWVTGPNWKWRVYISSDDILSATDGEANPTGAHGPLTVTASGERKWAMVGLFNTAAEGTANTAYQFFWENLAVFGTHGLTRQGEPGGLYVSDMVKNIAQRWAPLLDTSGVEATTFAVPQAAFTSETLPYDAFQTLNGYHRWEMNVYQGRKLHYYPIDLSDWDWEIRLSDPGVTVDLAGNDVSELCNGVTVRFTNLTTGQEERLTPTAHAELRDENPDNPANLHGIPAYTTLSLSVPTTEEGALQIGRAYLSDFNQALSPGTITIKAHVRDRAGHWQPVWRVRASDRVTITDLPNEQVRIVHETSYDHDSKTLQIALDSGFKRLDAILNRLGVQIEASGLQLP